MTSQTWFKASESQVTTREMFISSLSLIQILKHIIKHIICLSIRPHTKIRMVFLSLELSLSECFNELDLTVLFSTFHYAWVFLLSWLLIILERKRLKKSPNRDLTNESVIAGRSGGAFITQRLRSWLLSAGLMIQANLKKRETDGKVISQQHIGELLDYIEHKYKHS